MRLLQIPNYYFPHTGGIEQVARNIANSLSNEEVEHKIICFNEDVKRGSLVCHGSETRTDCIDGIEVRRCGCFAKIASQSLSFTYPQELRKLIRDFDPDVVVFHYPNPYVASFLLPMIKKKTRLIVFWDLDITKQKLLGKLFQAQTDALLKRAETVVAASPNYIEGSPNLSRFKEKCVVIPNCVTIDYENLSDSVRRKALRIKEAYKGKKICFTVGRHIPYKGFEYLIKASEHLSDDYVVLLGGSGPLTGKLKQQAKENDKVVFLGFVSDDDLLSYYLACDVITFSSITRNEAFGISLAEGMSFGKPAVTFTIPGSGVNFVNLNGVTGKEVANRDCEAYAKAIMEICDNKELYQQYSLAAKERVLEYFTYNAFKEKVIHLLLGDRI